MAVGMSPQQIPQQKLFEQRWRISNTFIELEEAHEEIDSSRSQSNGVTKRKAGSGSGLSNDASDDDVLKVECISDLREWHKRWVSTSGSSSNVDPASDLSEDSREVCREVLDGRRHDSEYTLQYAVEFHQKLQQEFEAGVEPRDAIADSYPHLDVCKMIPRGQDGEMLSIGSVRHLLDPCGEQCKPCGCFRRNKCYRKQLCLYCHFPHTRRQSGLQPGGRRKSKEKPGGSLPVEKASPDEAQPGRNEEVYKALKHRKHRSQKASKASRKLDVRMTNKSPSILDDDSDESNSEYNGVISQKPTGSLPLSSTAMAPQMLQQALQPWYMKGQRRIISL